MGRIIHENNGKTTIMVTGEDISNISPINDTYFVGVDLTTGILEKLNPNGDIISLESNNTTILNELVTYSEFYDKINSNTLTAGTYYTITDFETIYDQPDYYIDGGNKTSVITKTSSVDPIVVLATSTNTLSGDAYRLSTPNDKLKYDWTFSLTEVNALPAKGRITELIDSNDNRTDYDHTNVLFKRYQDYSKDLQLTGTITDYDCETGLVVGSGTTFLTDVSVDDIILIDTLADFGYNVGVKVVSISDDTNLYVTIDPNYSGTLFSLSSYNFYYGLALGTYTSYKEIYVGQSNENDYSEYNTFQGVSIDNYIGNYAIFKTEFILPFLLSNNVLLTDSISNVIGDYFYNNTINVTFSNNSIGTNFNSNILNGISFTNNNIGNYFEFNAITSEFINNNISNNFSTNTISSIFIGNSIGIGFVNNIVDSFGYGPLKGEGNIIGKSCKNNTFYDTCYGNIIGDGCQYNTFNQKFVDNNIGNGCRYNTFGINFGTGPFKNEGNIIGNLCEYNTFGDDCYGNVIGIACQNNSIGSYFQSNQIGNYFGNTGEGIVNTIYDYFRYNKIGNFFGNNTNFPSVGGGDSTDGGNLINSYFQFNEIGDNFIWNIIDSNFNYNKIGNDFWINIFGQSNTHNIIGDLFVGNVGITGFPDPIGDSFISNQIGNYTPYNLIDGGFVYNKIGNFFGNAGFGTENVIGSNFQNNIIGNYFGDDGTHMSGGNTTIGGFMLNNVETDTLYGVDFSLSTHVYGDYNCTILKASNATNVLSFVSGTTLTIDNVNV